jgi:AraC family transcriptional activator of tynA and feaB
MSQTLSEVNLKIHASSGYAWAQPFLSQGLAWVDPLRHDYYECEIESLSGDRKLDLVARRGMTSPYPVTLLSSRRRYAFWRSWNHIGDNKENLVMLRYVKAGAFSLTQCGVTVTVGAGQFSFSKSNVPFRWESLIGDMSVAEYYSVLLPLDLIHRFFPDGIPMKDSLSASPDRRLAMPALFSLLTDQGQFLEGHVAEMIVETILKEAAEVARQGNVQIDARKHICDKRTDEILAYLALHLSNPDISTTSVARACGISTRYLCYLLKLKGTSFSDLLWEERLKKTGEWLLALDNRHFTISEIAYMNGFKTAAHFSRLFKSYWGCSPREYRLSNGKSGVWHQGARSVQAIAENDLSALSESMEAEAELLVA